MVTIVGSWSEVEVMRNKESKIVPKIGEKHMKCGVDISLLSHMGWSISALHDREKSLGKASTILKGDGVPFLYKSAYVQHTGITHNLIVSAVHTHTVLYVPQK